MIRLIQKIRHKLLSEGKTVMYLKYAIGEILLVMIGILLALQVNKWNETRKEHQMEIKVLNEILSNLESDQISLESCITGNKKFITNCEKVLEHLNNDIPITDSLRYYYAQMVKEMRFSPNTVGYENVRTMGINIIGNEHLKKEISELYGHYYYKLRENRLEISDIVRKKLFDEMSENLYFITPLRKVEPINIKELRTNLQFKNAVINQKGVLEASNNAYIEGIEEIELVAQSIRNELKNNESTTK